MPLYYDVVTFLAIDDDKHNMTSKRRRADVESTSLRRIDFGTT